MVLAPHPTPRERRMVDDAVGFPQCVCLRNSGASGPRLFHADDRVNSWRHVLAGKLDFEAVELVPNGYADQ